MDVGKRARVCVRASSKRSQNGSREGEGEGLSALFETVGCATSSMSAQRKRWVCVKMCVCVCVCSGKKCVVSLLVLLLAGECAKRALTMTQ